MKRKVIKQGNNTLTITLPKKWSEKYDVISGQEIDVEESDNSLIITSGKKVTQKPLLIDKMNVNHCRSYISNAYKLGYDEIRVRFSSPSDLVSIQETVDKLMGFEIISNTKDSCVIKAIATIHKEEFSSMMKKAYQLNLVMFEMIQDDVKNNSLVNLLTIEQYNLKVISFTDFCRRLINKHGILNERADKSLYTVLLKINYVSTVMRDVYRYISKKKLKISNFSKQLLKNTENMYRTCFEGYFSSKLDLVDKGIAMKKKLYDSDGINLLEKLVESITTYQETRTIEVGSW